MTSQQRKRRRGVILTPQGQQKLRAAIAEIEQAENFGQKLTLEELSDRTGLDAGTVAKVLDGEKGCDRRTLERLFNSCGLELVETDYAKPGLGAVISKATQNPNPKTQTFIDWGEAVDASIFYGRTEELAILENWILNDRCRLVALLGMGGIGKTALSVRLSENIEGEFDYLIWRSLREAPPIEKILADCIKFLSNQQETDLPDTVGEVVTRLIHYLQVSRCLLVLDNAESILQEGIQAGQYREGYKGYEMLLQRVGESKHQSCLLITSREKPKEIAKLEGRNCPVRSFSVQGLQDKAGQEFLKAEGLNDRDSQWKQVFDYYGGNPLALKIAANTIQDLFGGNIAEFLKQGTGIFGDIRDLLEQQFERLSEMGQSVMYWLAIYREPTSIEELKEDILEPISTQELLETLESLRRRSLIERRDEGFTLQNVVMEYLTDRFVSKVTEEIKTQKIDLFNHHALIQATAKDYVRETQIRLILHPTANQLTDPDSVFARTLQTIRHELAFASGYAAGNVLNLFCQLNIDHLNQSDFSNLTLRYSFLKDVKLHGVNFASAQFIKPALMYAFRAITSVAFSPNQKLLAAGDINGEIHLWQVTARKFLKTLQGHTDWVRSVAFSPDGKTLASGSDDMTVRLWDLNTHQCLHSFRRNTGWGLPIAFSPDGKTLASGSDDMTVRLWDLSTRQCLHSFREHTNWVLSVAFSPDGKTLASGSGDKTVRLWDLSTRQCLHSFRGHTALIRSVAFSPDGETLASGSGDMTVRLWDLSTRQCLHSFQEHTRMIYSVAFSPDGKTLASGSGDMTVRLWDLNTRQCLHVFQGHTSLVRAVTFSPDGKILTTGSVDTTIRLWDVSTRERVHSFQGHTSWVLSIAFSPDGKTLASGSADAMVRLWDLNTRQCLHVFQGHIGLVRSVAFNPDGTTLASGSEDTTVRLWDLSTRKFVYSLPGHTGWISSIAFSPDGKNLVSGGGDTTLRLWNLNTRQCLHVFKGHTGWVSSVAFSPDGKNLVSGSEDTTVCLWDLSTRQFMYSLKGHTNLARSVVMSPDGKTLATGSVDKTVRLWDMSTRQCLHSFQGQTSLVSSVAFSPDGKKLASGNGDGTVCLWDLSTHQCIYSFHEHSSLVNSVVFSPDGKKLASGSEDGTIRLWSVHTGECIAVLRILRPYEGMNITGATGLTEAQKTSMISLGAVSED